MAVERELLLGYYVHIHSHEYSGEMCFPLGTQEEMNRILRYAASLIWEHAPEFAKDAIRRSWAEWYGYFDPRQIEIDPDSW